MIAIKLSNKYSAVTIMSSVFILLVMSATAYFLVDISADTNASINILSQGKRAFFAAKSGVEWGLTTAVKNAACPAATTVPINQGGLIGFSAYVTCTSPSANKYNVTAVATYGTFGQFGYVTRTATGKK